MLRALFWGKEQAWGKTQAFGHSPVPSVRDAVPSCCERCHRWQLAPRRMENARI